MRLLLERFEHLSKGDILYVGALDFKIREFVVSVLDEMLKCLYNEDLYFQYVEILAEFVYMLSDYETGYRVWSNLDFGLLSSISDSVVEEREKLVNIKLAFS
jgi:hypothetical protein